MTVDGHNLDPQHWLQFDAKNQEFYGIPKQGDLGQKDYLLIAKDREGLSATDALIVVVNPPMHKRDYSVLFEMTLGIPYEQFNNSLSQRRFVERIGQVFADPITSHLQMRSIRHIHHDGNTQVTFYNTTLHRLHQKCPNDEIEVLRNILLHHDGSIKEKVRDILGNEFNLMKVGMVPVGTCQGKGLSGIEFRF
jgi:dystroglycan 1